LLTAAQRSLLNYVDMFWMLIIMIFPLGGIALFFVLPTWMALPVYLVGTGLSILYHHAMMQSAKERTTTGRRGMVGLEAEVLFWEGASGEVRCHSEIWSALSKDGRSFARGDRVKVTDCEGLTLSVQALDAGGTCVGSSAGRSAPAGRTGDDRGRPGRLHRRLGLQSKGFVGPRCPPRRRLVGIGDGLPCRDTKRGRV
jgi:membrane protein implicated in regulation of membrane protease activity